MTFKTNRAALATLLAAVSLTTASAQPNAVHKTTLQQQPFPPAPAYHSITVKTVVDPGGLVAPHTHPGVEMAYVVGGQAEVKIAGQADRSLAAGDSFSVPAGTVHSVRNQGPGPLTLVSTYLVDASKPIASPAP
jgi:quercetin dioxygenase-like cupin family protein